MKVSHEVVRGILEIWNCQFEGEGGRGAEHGKGSKLDKFLRSCIQVTFAEDSPVHVQVAYNKDCVFQWRHKIEHS